VIYIQHLVSQLIKKFDGGKQVGRVAAKLLDKCPQNEAITKSLQSRSSFKRLTRMYNGHDDFSSGPACLEKRPEIGLNPSGIIDREVSSNSDYAPSVLRLICATSHQD
jgi:hypothetical protein